MTPYYQDDAVTIYHGDAREIAPGLTADAVLTDPPYGFGAYATDRAVADLLTLLRPIAPTLAVFGYPETLVAWCIEAVMKPDEWVTWWPTNKPAARGGRLAKETEHVAIFGPTPGAREVVRPRSKNTAGRRIAVLRGNDPDWARDGDVWRDPSPMAGFNAANGRVHPNEKPVGLLRKLVTLCTAEGAVVLDPFAGSGTTLRAAKDLGRKAIGIEIEQRFCEEAARRCSQEVLGLAV